MLSLKERFRAKGFGYTRVVSFRRSNSVPFQKFFLNEEEMQKFIKEALEVGTTVTKIETL